MATKSLPKPVLEMLARNKKFAESYHAPPRIGPLLAPLKVSRAGVIVLSCSDPRLNPDKILGLDATLGATHIRNAGGRALEAIRTLTILQTLSAPGTIVVIHHTDCGTTQMNNKEFKAALIERAPNEEKAIESIDFAAIEHSIEESVVEDVDYLKDSPLIIKDTQIIGLKYDIDTGILTEVKVSTSGL